jgi:hypothetical protein
MKIIVASYIFLPNIALAAVAEAMAMKEGLALANHNGCNNVIMESESLEPIQACTGEDAWWGESLAIFVDCADLTSLIDQASFKHCPREANGVAHEIASSCFSTKVSCNWVDEPLVLLFPNS